MGWARLGLVFKRQFSVGDAILARTERLTRKLSDLHLGKADDYGQVALIHEMREDLRPEMSKEMATAVRLLDEYYDLAAQEMKDTGGVKTLFPASAIARNKVQLAEYREQMSAKDLTISSDALMELKKKINVLEGHNVQLSKQRYSPIAADWFAELYKNDPTKLTLTVANKLMRQRKSISLADLLEAGISLEQMDVRTTLTRYGKNFSRTLPMLQIREAAIAEGAMTRIQPVAVKHGFVKVSPVEFPLFKDHWVHPGMLEYWKNELAAANSRDLYTQVAGFVKDMQFWNPSYLGFNNALQGAVFGSYRGIGTPKAIYQAIRQQLGIDYQMLEQARMDGAFSQPTFLTQKVWDQRAYDATYPMQKRMLREVFSMAGFTEKGWNPAKGLRSVHQNISSLAWGFDQGTRLVTYNFLLNKGVSRDMAGQMTALVHGAYDSIPAQFRNKAGKMLFTPTYKLAMAKYYSMMGKGFLKSIQGKEIMDFVYDADLLDMDKSEIVKMKRVGGEENARYIRDLGQAKKAAWAFGGAAVAMLALQAAKDQAMVKQGFTRDVAGYRYYKVIEGEDGPEELVVSLGGFDTLLTKTIWRMKEALSTKNDRPFFYNFLRAFKYEFHPLLRPLFFDFTSGKTADGKYIYNIYDDAPGTFPINKIMKSTHHLLKEYVSIIGKVENDYQNPEAKEEFNKQFGGFLRVALGFGAYSYTRSIREIRKTGMMSGMVATGLDQIIKQYDEGIEPSTRQLENLQKLLENLVED